MLNQSPIERVFHALGDPTRRAIIERLGQGPSSAGALAEPLGVTLAAVMQHLQVLEGAGLVRTEKLGRVRSCQLRPDGLRLAESWLAERRTLWERRFDRLGEILEEAAPPPPSTRKQDPS